MLNNTIIMPKRLTRHYKPSIMEAAPITPKMLAAVKPGETLTVSIDPVEEA